MVTVKDMDGSATLTVHGDYDYFVALDAVNLLSPGMVMLNLRKSEAVKLAKAILAAANTEEE